MRMSDTVSVQESGETMRVIIENNTTAADDDITMPQSCRQNQHDGDGNGNDDKSDMQRQKPGQSTKRPKLKLVRSLAICEEPSPSTITTQLPQDQQDAVQIKFSQMFDTEETLLTMNKDDEDQSAIKLDKLEKMPCKILSRDSSQEYTDSTGIDLHEFLVNTLKNNPRDRMMLLKLEQDILDFISRDEIQRRKFPPMTSYHRMLLHRVAAYFGLDHNIDQTGKCVVINKTSNTRIPDQKFSEHIKDDKTDEFQKRYILKRDNSSTDKDDSIMRMKLKEDRRSRSIEEREEEYQRARERIFADGLDAFQLDTGIQEDEVCNNIHQRRQIFRLQDSRSGSSRQSSSENESKCSEPRPWSSTDSDSSSRILKPAMTKASSFSGIPVLMRGDSSSSCTSVGRLSKTGSDCSSVGSSTGSLCRPPVPVLTPLSYPAVSTSSGVSYEPPVPAANASYYLLPLEAAGIPPGSVLLNPHTGQPFVNPDGSAVMYNPVTPLGSSTQPSLPPPPPAHHQTANQHTAQPQDNLSGPFGHMTLVRHPSEDVREAHTVVYPSPAMLPAPLPPQQAGYMVPSPGQTVPTSAFPAQPTVNQPIMQPQQSFMQPQMAVCYCSPGQYSVCGHQYRPAGRVQYSNAQSQTMPPPPHAPAQQTGYQTVMSNHQQSYQNVLQQPVVNSPHSGMSVMLQYPSVPSYQVSMPHAVQQPVISPAQVPASSIQVYYSIIPPNQHNNISSSVGFLPPHGAEQMPFPRRSPPCGSQQFPAPHCSGVPPPPVGGVVMMQLALPAAQQWKHNKHYSTEHTHTNTTQLSNPSTSTARSSTLPHLTTVKNSRPSHTLPIMPQFSGSLVSGQGDVRYPLLGQTLQYSTHMPLHTLSSHQSHVEFCANTTHRSRQKNAEDRSQCR
ncbi:R3H domain-containing protein 1-like isoform X1 [Xyrauchen texanus]|uniref:R3H domain-containing protein 1-like isoform X1 n=1 Tax=Xyrauchen texanus TaxID=154827 RepID=UPI002241E079|nr:R3H domain-containing protein 1-like isoform X1 [Xyrauchen texanus]XP_051998493.1 R3H domain-containing protein 1-like isoform X1 [Xyrauchen texanus]XP_051998494.1 R3H domain-containing protein 1-like isoform X1 [Xyrauchen texanus]